MLVYVLLQSGVHAVCCSVGRELCSVLPYAEILSRFPVIKPNKCFEKAVNGVVTGFSQQHQV